MPKKYSDEFKKDALQYMKDHPELDKRVCAEYLGVPYDTLYSRPLACSCDQSVCMDSYSALAASFLEAFRP